MTAKSLPSLVLDEMLTRALKRVRSRAALNPIFKGIVVPIDDFIGHRVIATGSFEATQLDGISQILDSPENFGIQPRPGIFVDVGANIGLFSIALQRHFERTIAIEANPLTFGILKINVALRDMEKSIECLCAAASDSPGTATLSFPSNGNLSWATLGDFGYERSATVSKNTLDQMLSLETKVGLIKIDVEHHEREVLEGARTILTRDRPIVLFESLEIDIATRCAEILAECGYTRFFRFVRRPHQWWRRPRFKYDVLIEELETRDFTKAALICAV